MTFILLFVFNALLTSCIPFDREPDYIKIQDRIVANYANQLKNENGLFFMGGGGSFMNNVKKISLTFVSYQKMSVDEARDLYVKIMEGYLQRVNQDKQIRPYLDQYPFTRENMEICIMFFNSDNKFTLDGVAAIHEGKHGEVVYCGYANKLYDLYRESYEQSLQLARRLLSYPCQ